MKATQLLSIELGPECNLGQIHPRCPNRNAERFAHVTTKFGLLSDEKIIEFVCRAHEDGFAGYVCWHYYNEPLLYKERMFRLMKEIRERVPSSKFYLWTNGTSFPEKMPDFQMFSGAFISDYGNYDKRAVEMLKRILGPQNVKLRSVSLDDRLRADQGELSYRPCSRMLAEMPIDCYGNVHLCCYDWRGVGFGSPLNIQEFPYEVIIERWQRVRDSIAGMEMASNAPTVCRWCKMRSPRLESFVPSLVPAGNHYLAEQSRVQLTRVSKRIGVVVVHYHKVPMKRLTDHFKWNGTIYKNFNACVYVVTEKEKEVPHYARCIIVPLEKLPKRDGKPIFSLSLTKNQGIRTAIEDGCSPIIATDIDLAFSEEAFLACAHAKIGMGAAPVYLMAKTYEQRSENDPKDFGMTGTISLSLDDWRRLPYNENFVGYGGEDGELMRRIAAAGIRMNRQITVWHIAHDPKAPQKNIPGKGREDCWGRKDGFNPENYTQNRANR